MVITTALLVGLPYTLASEGEAMIVQQEREYAQQQNGAQQVSRGCSLFQQGQLCGTVKTDRSVSVSGCAGRSDPDLSSRCARAPAL